ncbi:hypothetical protein G7046_g5185 [Stylonectria norvegica]|nr:hypothetical protein G7046_g5185 [Stylonectria norvegica]
MHPVGLQAASSNAHEDRQGLERSLLRVLEGTEHRGSRGPVGRRQGLPAMMDPWSSGPPGDTIKLLWILLFLRILRSVRVIDESGWIIGIYHSTPSPTLRCLPAISNGQMLGDNIRIIKFPATSTGDWHDICVQYAQVGTRESEPQRLNMNSKATSNRDTEPAVKRPHWLCNHTSNHRPAQSRDASAIRALRTQHRQRPPIIIRLPLALEFVMPSRYALTTPLVTPGRETGRLSQGRIPVVPGLVPPTSWPLNACPPPTWGCLSTALPVSAIFKSRRRTP